MLPFTLSALTHCIEQLMAAGCRTRAGMAVRSSGGRAEPRKAIFSRVLASMNGRTCWQRTPHYSFAGNQQLTETCCSHPEHSSISTQLCVLQCAL